jgi:membrane-associated phospholipid phosphatase
VSPSLHNDKLALLGVVLLSAFTAVTLDTVYGGPLTVLEQQLAPGIDYRAFPDLVSIMLTLSHLGSTAFVSAAAGIVTVVLLIRRSYSAALLLISSVYGGMLLNAALKQVFQRGRPVVEDPLLLLHTYSFPSGHAAAATVLYGCLALLVAGRHRPSRLAVVACASLIIATVGASRVYLAVHYLTDVFAGALVGCAWLLLCYVLIYRAAGPGSRR